ncbi:DODA-type extradiol aromatic ring-opening family dioxygenase [Parathalassolituus penaei]|uniref:Class III extradiol ring-cleavage dioxygenase n=1 Tax=Parathalassolituus penaei TaxID=2997323 RepID=A0A9X3EEP4_9GAMM|nr:class III extradiol ring-cleavage dioxygenase [Parathalassolituus penaei]MCY0965419.1 class III extradiol ring-cleavage dioxygenase [Parathalassolituus penaei]
MAKNTDVLFVSHGGGPMPLLGDPGHREMVTRLKEITGQLRKPDAILVISAHWEESVATVTTGANPDLIYDYYGFPPESYHIKYPSGGQPQLANQVVEALKSAGVPVRADDRRGFDHGVFVPLKIMFPEANIPVVQLSLVHSLDPAVHVAIGKALQNLDFDNLLVLGSGFSFHNMRAFFAPNTPELQDRNLQFERWLLETCASPNLTEAQREERFVHWAEAPYARFCHPREEHLLPLHVCYGLAGKPVDAHWSAVVLNKASGMFLWRV